MTIAICRSVVPPVLHPYVRRLTIRSLSTTTSPPHASPLPAASSERHEEDPVRPLLIEGAFQEQQDILDGTTDRVPTADRDDSAHRLTAGHPLIGVPWHSLAIVGEEHTTLPPRPVQHDR